jgi:hypothetical protein
MPTSALFSHQLSKRCNYAGRRRGLGCDSGATIQKELARDSRSPASLQEQATLVRWGQFFFLAILNCIKYIVLGSWRGIIISSLSQRETPLLFLLAPLAFVTTVERYSLFSLEMEYHVRVPCFLLFCLLSGIASFYLDALNVIFQSKFYFFLLLFQAVKKILLVNSSYSEL